MKTKYVIERLMDMQKSVSDTDSYIHSLSHDWESKTNRAEYLCADIDTQITNLIEAINAEGISDD